MSGLSWPQRALTVKLEGTYGVDPVPVDADGVVAYNVNINPLEGEIQDDDVLPNGMLGGAQKFLINKSVTLDFEIDWVGHANPGTAPAASAIYRSCCMAEVITPGTSVAYSEVSSNEESCTFYFNLDGHQHRITGFKGKLGYALSPDGKLRLKVSGTGIFNAPTKVAFPTVTYAAYQSALKTNPDTITSLLVHGWAGEVRSLEFDSGSDIQNDNLLTSRRSVLADRSASGSIVMENPDLADKDWFAAIGADDVGALSWEVNEGAGRIVQCTHPQVQLLSPKYGNEKNQATLSADLNIFPDRGNQISGFNFTFL